MNLFTHILVPTDFSAAADRAIDYAIELAEKFDARLTLFHATGSPVSSFSADAKGVEWSADDARKFLEKKMSDALTKVKARRPGSEAYVVEGDPWAEIPKFAGEHGIDLMVMGTHGRRGLAHALFGSVSEKVARRSDIPILTISGRNDAE